MQNIMSMPIGRKFKEMIEKSQYIVIDRIINENGKIINDCNDDGESRAGDWVLEPLMVRLRGKKTG